VYYAAPPAVKLSSAVPPCHSSSLYWVNPVERLQLAVPRKRDLNLIPTSSSHISLHRTRGACQDVTPAAIICPALDCEILDIAWLFLASCREPEIDFEIVLPIWSIRGQSSCISAEKGFCCVFAGVFDCSRKR
jgi:hypothetical protein